MPPPPPKKKKRVRTQNLFFNSLNLPLIQKFSIIPLSIPQFVILTNISKP